MATTSKPRRGRKSKAASELAKPKLSVFADRDLLKTIRREKAETDLTIEEIVNTRLRMSYASHPGPLVVAG